MAAVPEYSVKVNNVPPGTRSDQLRHSFESCGYTDITDVYLPEKFLKQGFGFVRFSAPEQAQRAAEDSQLYLNQAQLNCEAALTEKRKIGLTQEQAVQPSPSGEYSVWIGNMPGGVGSDQLRDEFGSRGVGGMTDVYIPPDKGFGFVRFGSYDEACSALNACEGLAINGRLLELKLSAGKQKAGGKGCAPEQPFAWGCGGGGCFSQPGPMPGCGAGAWGYGSGGYAPMGKGATMMRQPDVFERGYNVGVQGVGPGKVAEHSVWVGNLTQGVTREELSEAFGSRGVTSMTDVYVPPGKDYGFVRFAVWEEAANAQQSCQDLHIRGVPVDLKISSQEKLKRGGGPGPPAVATPMGCKGHSMVGCTPGGYGFAAAAPPGCYGFAAAAGKGHCFAAAQAPPGKGGYGFAAAAPPGKGCFGGGQKGFGMDMGGGGQKGFGMDMGGGGQKGFGMDMGGGGGGHKASKTEISVKVGNLAPGTSTDDLWRAFSAWGIAEMSDVYIPSGKSFGFLRFQKMSFAQAAMQCAGMNVCGSSVTCELAEGGKRSADDMAWFGGPQPMGLAPAPQMAVSGNAEVSIKVGNLPAGTTSQEIMEAFASQGIDMMTDCYIPMGRPFGFVRFASQAAGRIALQRTMMVRGTRVDLEPAVNTKRSSGEMAGGKGPPPMMKMQRMAAPPQQHFGAPAFVDSNASGDAPSVKVSMVPTGCTSDELRRALLEAGCAGHMTDVYVPKGDRGFGFVRFNTPQEAYDAAELRASIRGAPLGLEVAVQERRGRR